MGLLIQRHINRLFHRHSATFRPERVVIRFSQHGAQLSNELVVLDLFRVRHWGLDFVARGFRRPQEVYGPLRFFFYDGDKGKTF